uniref:Putative secreted peptide n=1 Tax=Anopheles braziliensis TaxID=58242 RepID=A0A2M3ZMZ5_9DIPT
MLNQPEHGSDFGGFPFFAFLPYVLIIVLSWTPCVTNCDPGIYPSNCTANPFPRCDLAPCASFASVLRGSPAADCFRTFPRTDKT